MEETFSIFQTSSQNGSDVLFPLLLMYLEVLIVCAVFVMIGRLVQQIYNEE